MEVGGWLMNQELLIQTKHSHPGLRESCYFPLERGRWASVGRRARDGRVLILTGQL